MTQDTSRSIPWNLDELPSKLPFDKESQPFFKFYDVQDCCPKCNSNEWSNSYEQFWWKKEDINFVKQVQRCSKCGSLRKAERNIKKYNSFRKTLKEQFDQYVIDNILSKNSSHDNPQEQNHEKIIQIQ